MILFGFLRFCVIVCKENIVTQYVTVQGISKLNPHLAKLGFPLQFHYNCIIIVIIRGGSKNSKSGAGGGGGILVNVKY